MHDKCKGLHKEGTVYSATVKFQKMSPGVYMFIFFKGPFWGADFWRGYIRRGLSTEGNLCFKIDWASLIVGSKFTVSALFYFAFKGNFPSTSTRVAYIWRSNLTEGFWSYPFGGLYSWRGLFWEFYGILQNNATLSPTWRVPTQKK